MFRVGAPHGRGIYHQHATAMSDGDRYLGVMDKPEMSRAVVEALNREAATPADRIRLLWAVNGMSVQ